MRSVVLSATLTALIIILSLSASAQVANGSFESGSQNPGSAWLVLGAGSTAIDGWTIDQGSIDYIGGWWPASDGVRSVDLNGLSTGQVSQYVPTVPGSTYVVSFDMSGNSDGLPLVKQLTVMADGAQAASFGYDIAASGNNRSDMKWVRQQYTFVAQSNWTLLAFASATEGFFGPALDNVTVELRTPDPEPEPLAGICHRSNGKHGPKTLYVDPHAYPAHIAHGDTEGPCEVE